MEIVLLIALIVLLLILNGGLKSRLNLMNKRIANIETYLKKISANTSTNPAPKTQAEVISPPVVKPETVVKPVIKPKSEQPIPIVVEPLKPVKTTAPPVELVTPTPLTPPLTAKPKTPPTPPEPSWYENFRKNNPDLEKFIGENLASKIGVAILVLGIAFFVKFAIDKNWINEVARVGIGILCGGIVMTFAHKLHKTYKAFSSVLVGGAISIFYFTIGIAFHQYHLFSQPVAFTIMVIITGFSVFLSIVYNRMELATLSLIGGFAVPFMLSTGHGNYKILFVYILILDIGMLVLAYLRKWNLITLLAYLFTMLLYTVWVQTKVIGNDVPPYRGALFFGTIFYLVFSLMNIINNVKEKRPFGAMELSMQLSNTFLYFGLGMQLLHFYHPNWQGLFSVALAGFNFSCAYILYKRFKADSRLVYVMIGLTLTFVTIAAPIQLKGNYITLFWAAEAVVLMWLSQRSGIVVFKLASVIISILMGFSLVLDWQQLYSAYSYELKLPVLINRACTSGLAAVGSLGMLWYLARQEKENSQYMGLTFRPLVYGKLILFLSVLTLYFTGLFETMYQFNYYNSFIETKCIVFAAYHLLFFAVLNGVVKPTHQTPWTKGLSIANSINLMIFVLGFSMLPIVDFETNLYTPYTSQIGFVAHYVALVAFVFSAVWLYRYCKQFSKQQGLLWFMSLLAFSGVLISSSELMLHILKFSVSSVKEVMESYTLKENEYETVKKHVVKIGFPVLWGLLAFIYLFIGMKKRFKPLRVAALVLLGITLLKLFLLDINTTSEAGKIIAFICLGLVLLVISFMYQKIKALILNDDEQNLSTNPKNEVEQNEN